jgi:signal peptidase II
VIGHNGQVNAEEPLPPRKLGLLLAAAGTALTADLVTKVLVVSRLEGRESVRLLGGALYLDLYRNPGAAFSLATGMTWLLSLVAIAVVVVILRLAPKLRSTGWAAGLGLILGGATGNLVDRIFREPAPLRGHVVDFVSVFADNGRVFPVFNLADSSIVVGGCLLVLMAVLGRDYDGRSASPSAQSTSAQSTSAQSTSAQSTSAESTSSQSPSAESTP